MLLSLILLLLLLTALKTTFWSCGEQWRWAARVEGLEEVVLLLDLYVSPLSSETGEAATILQEDPGVQVKWSHSDEDLDLRLGLWNLHLLGLYLK